MARGSPDAESMDFEGNGARLKVQPIMYHDVVEARDYAASGFPGEGANVYKVDRLEFGRQLEAIRAAVGEEEVCLTFDDGGASAYQPVAGMLERYGWRGYFFITTDWIGKRGFLSEGEIRELKQRGHIIGSHSCSHPTRMARIEWTRMLEEWRKSTEVLGQIVGEPVKVASVPGGYYSRRVAEAAAEAGIGTLFTSEPTARVHVVNGCRVVGRYVVRRGMGPEWAAGFAAGRLGPRLRQALGWKTKQLAKAVGGEVYLRVREALLNR
jgi:peptidoglycan/xylan/chitin deacetylase (PgdA/CDA1 family)